MDLEQIRCFLSVAELASFSAAARRHYVTQPAVSLRIRSLEEAVGEALIERSGPAVRLTAAGEIFRDRCREAVAALDRGLAEVSDLSGLKRGRLAVGSIDAAGVDLLPPLFRKYHALHPGIDLVVRIEPSGALVQAVIDRRLDCAVVTLPVNRSDLEVMPLEEETLVLVAPPGTGRPASPGRGVRPAGRSRAGQDVLARLPLIAYPRESMTRRLIDAELAERRLAPRTAMELSHPEAILRMVEAGLGAAVLPEQILTRARLPIVHVESFKVRRWLGLVLRKGEAPSPAARAFRDLLMKERPPEGGGRAARPAQRAEAGVARQSPRARRR